MPRQELDLQQYIRDLRGAENVLDGSNPAAAHALRLNLSNQWIVPSGNQSLTVNTDWLARALLLEETAPAGNAAELRQARQHLTALRESAEALATPTPAPDLSRARMQADRILRDRAFQGSHDPTWLDKLRQRAYAWISRQLDKLFGHMGISTTVGNTVAWIVVVLAACILAFWTVRALIASASRSEINLRGAAPAGKDWRYWAAEARAAAERSDYRSAIHAAYWSAVARLEEGQLLPEDRSRTPRESLRLMKPAAAAYAPFSDLTRQFELTWYGYHAATQDDWDDAMQQLETLRCQPSSTPTTAD